MINTFDVVLSFGDLHHIITFTHTFICSVSRKKCLKIFLYILFTTIYALN